MSQGSSLSNDLDGTMCDLEGSQQQQQHPCQCSTMSGINSIRTQRDRTDRSVMGSTRISNNQELPRGLETLQSAFEPLRRLDSPMSHQEARSVEIMEHQNTPLTRHARNVPCSPRNLDLSRNLAFEAARRVQESSSLQESRQSLTSSPSHLSDTNPNPMETSLSSKETSEKQLDDPCGLSPKQNISKDKLKNIQQVLNTYQHHRIPISGESNTPERNVHGHFHGDSHVHLHKHNVDNTSRTNANLEASEGLKGFQQRQQHSHHHHGTPKTSSVTHHHGSAMIHHAGGHHHGNLAAGLVGHIHSNPTTSLSGSGNGNPTINHGNTVTGSNNSNSHHHANPIAAGTSTTTMTTTTITMTTTTTMMSAVAGTTTTTSIIGQKGSPLTSHRHPTVSSAMSGTSSNSSMMNHGGSPSVHRHVSVNASASLSATPLVARHHGSSSTGSLTGRSSVNHHHVSSGISCESSSSNANTRTHSRLDHVHDHHHLLQQVHSLHPDSRSRDRAASLVHPLDEQQHHSHHHGHVHAHGHPHLQSNDTKNSSLIRMDAIQVSAPSKSSKCQCHAVQQGNRNKRNSEGETDDSGGIVEVTSRTHQPPALPPRPPPRPTRRYETASADQCHTGEGGCCKKYVVLCCLCGGLSAGVGSVFLAVHAVLSAHTASLALFETVPSYIPGIMLILMGLFTMLLARRKHRYGLLMKVCGSVGVVCALVCVLVTVTTTVIHMSRLQGLRECVYTARARSCTCYGAPQSKGDPGVLFEGTPHCEAVHGALYTCLRALFGVSVAGILACIFSCMLVYQLLSHEKKKMYWEQLELRCRSLYGQGGPVGPPTASCGCCNDCGGASPWWAQTPGNLYTPNPDLAPSRRWRLPWSRPRGPAPSPDSNYGFHTQTRQTETNPDNTAGPYSVLNSQSSGPYSVLNTPNGPYTPSTASYSVLETPVPLWGPPPPYSDPNSPARRPQVADTRPRMSKRIDNFDGNEDHRSRSTKRPSDNYENAEEISNSTDPEGGNDGTMKGRRARKPLKGVENGAFQQEPNPGGKQSESELYFGDVSSCCGPESSFYDLAVEKEGAKHSEGVDYLAARLGKRQLSKRSRLPLPLPSDGGDIPSDSYANSDEPRNTRGPFLAPDAQYEVIQQARYTYYAPKEDEELDEEAATSSYFREEDTDRPRERDYRDYHSGQEEETPQCCLSDSTTLDSGWQSGEQQQSDDNVRPVNV
ncbi:PREDICTED: uncharacterized protein LOC107071078 isoform X1 [Polistes dominula]|uniref:Uncharacterized protein LOC107071078 isoform X1 n=1 Tax=Polistes dominula TaxID=743375 RepID=A0ABM1IYG8_POLDO|nr:PREDICTED: uncharacterized protein LOC107071078 isoform X1 [Polistes dominula]